MLSNQYRRGLSAGAAAGLFALFSLGWIAITDSLVLRLPENLPLNVQTAKGTLFVLLVTLLLYVLLRYHEGKERERIQEMQEIFHQLPAAAWQTDRDLRMTWFTGGEIGLPDFPPDALVGRTVREIVGADSPAVVAHQRALEGQPLNRYLLDFGGRKFSSSVVPLRNEKGEVVGTLGAATDITELLESRHTIATVEQKLDESESLWQAMIEQSLIGIYIIVDGRLEYANRRAREMIGYTMDELRALPSALDVVMPEDREIAATNLRRRTAGEDAPNQYTIKMRHKNGSSVDIELFATMVKYHNKPALLGAAIEVTSRLDRERLQRQSELWFRTLIEASQDMVGVMGLDGTYLYVSPSVERVLGYKPEELVGRSPFDFTHEGDRARLQEEVRALIDGGPPLMTTLRFCDASGQWHIIQASARMATNPQGEPIVIINSADTTRMRKLERQYAESERLASLGRVASAMAHEFNNVLMAISPFAELLRKGAADEKQRGYANRIMTSIERGRHVTQDVLRYTRASRPVLKPLNARELFDGLRSDLVQLLPSSIRLEIDADPELTLLGDANQLSQLFVNLAINARDAMPAGGSLVIRATRAKSTAFTRSVVDGEATRFAYISFADTGVGMPEEVMERMFEPMFTTRKAQGGTGLGLSVVHEGIRAHGGQITAESVIGEGTTFHLFIPLAEEVAVPAPLQRNPTGDVKIENLLLVEDDDAVAEAVGESLRERGLDPTRVATAAAAIELTGRQHFDVAIIDVGLPDLDGIRLAHTLREIGHDLCVVFVTGHADEREFAELIAKGDVILHKPFESDELIRSLAKVTADWRSRRQAN